MYRHRGVPNFGVPFFGGPYRLLQFLGPILGSLIIGMCTYINVYMYVCVYIYIYRYTMRVHGPSSQILGLQVP